MASDPPGSGVAAQKGGHGKADGWDIPARARSLHLEEGLYALTVGAIDADAIPNSGPGLPATYIAAAPGEDPASMTVLTSQGEAPGWVGAEGGAVAARVPAGGGSLVVTTYGVTEAAHLPQLEILDLQALGRPDSAAIAAAAVPSGREIASELILHIERQGDRRLPGQGWAGNPGQRLRIEGFAIRPLEVIAPGDLEYMGYGPAGRQTPWVSDAKLCGTRGRGLPLTGFAIRLAPRLRERFDVIYEGYFFDSGVTGPARNGEPCLPASVDDPLSAVRLRLVKRPD